jgi:hypothetical protein
MRRPLVPLVLLAVLAGAPALAAQQPAKQPPPAERQPPRQAEPKRDTGKKAEPEKPRESGRQPADKPRSTGEPQLKRHKPN